MKKTNILIGIVVIILSITGIVTQIRLYQQQKQIEVLELGVGVLVDIELKQGEK